MHDPHLAAVGLVDMQDHPAEGRIRAIRPTVIENGVTPGGDAVAPVLGANSRSLLEEVGFAAWEIDALLASGAISSERQLPDGRQR
jgi:crotonobetainyl-CoA:carnitine CoA-transferase CaiB-like acyl-CoA transferase